MTNDPSLALSPGDRQNLKRHYPRAASSTPSPFRIPPLERRLDVLERMVAALEARVAQLEGQ